MMKEIILYRIYTCREDTLQNISYKGFFETLYGIQVYDANPVILRPFNFYSIQIIIKGSFCEIYKNLPYVIIINIMFHYQPTLHFLNLLYTKFRFAPVLNMARICGEVSPSTLDTIQRQAIKHLLEIPPQIAHSILQTRLCIFTFFIDTNLAKFKYTP